MKELLLALLLVFSCSCSGSRYTELSQEAEIAYMQGSTEEALDKLIVFSDYLKKNLPSPREKGRKSYLQSLIYTHIRLYNITSFSGDIAEAKIHQTLVINYSRKLEIEDPRIKATDEEGVIKYINDLEAISGNVPFWKNNQNNESTLGNRLSN